MATWVTWLVVSFFGRSYRRLVVVVYRRGVACIGRPGACISRFGSRADRPCAPSRHGWEWNGVPTHARSRGPRMRELSEPFGGHAPDAVTDRHGRIAKGSGGVCAAAAVTTRRKLASVALADGGTVRGTVVSSVGRLTSLSSPPPPSAFRVIFHTRASFFVYFSYRKFSRYPSFVFPRTGICWFLSSVADPKYSNSGWRRDDDTVSARMNHRTRAGAGGGDYVHDSAVPKGRGVLNGPSQSPFGSWLAHANGSRHLPRAMADQGDRYRTVDASINNNNNNNNVAAVKARSFSKKPEVDVSFENLTYTVYTFDKFKRGECPVPAPSPSVPGRPSGGT